MTNSLRTFMTIILVFASFLAASAAGKNTYFHKFSDSYEYEYTYVSPVMLKAMGGQILDNKSYGSLPISTADLTSIETLSTVTHGKNEDLWKTIREVISSKKMETLSTKKSGMFRYDILARLSGDNKFITNLMVVTQNGGNNVSIVYMEGKIPVSSLQFALNK